MATQLPRCLLRDCMLWANRDSLIGQVGEISLPVPTEKVEELRNAGMAMPIEVKLGYEKPESSFKMPGMLPEVMKLYGLKPGTETPFMITGALVDEDGEVHSAVANIRGFIRSADPGTWKTGEMAENSYEISIRSYALEIDGQPIIEMTPFDVKIGGVSQYAPIRSALLVD